MLATIVLYEHILKVTMENNIASEQVQIETDRDIYSVSELNHQARTLLETQFASIWVEGEISNLSRPASGHIYFTLKDEAAQIRCAMFRFRNNRLDFSPQDGTHVLAKAKVSLYEGRGDYQLIVDYMEERGDGLLRRAFEILKQKLATEGLFDESHKKALPLFPKCIGVVTSPTGAAIRDVLAILKRRFPSIPVLIYPTQVQGEAAAGQISRAIALANQHQQCDVLIVCRGGGSLEDLWPFNEEIVARAIHQSTIPIVSGIGHEIDITIADFVADKRAATPSAAAELISPDQKEWLHKIQQIHTRFVHLIRVELRHIATLTTNLEKRLQHPGQRLQQLSQQFDYIEQRLHKIFLAALRHKIEQLNQLNLRLHKHNPKFYFTELKTHFRALRQQITQLISHKLIQQNQQLAHLGRALHTVSPLNTLDRGYAMVFKAEKIISDLSQVHVGDELKTELAHGFIFSSVTHTRTKE